jgi:mono/diheme cytochrome c family protein
MPLTKSVMPDFQLTDEEALSLTEYLMARQDPRIPKMGSTEFRSTPEAVKEGKRLYEDVYGCDGCHQAGDKGGIAGPNLSQAGKRLKTE